jgi:hypothetical protein
MRGKTPEVDGLKAGQSVGAFGTAADSDRYPYWHQYDQVFISEERFRSIGQMGEGEKKLRIGLGGKGGKGRHVKSAGGAAGAGQLGKRIGKPDIVLCKDPAHPDYLKDDPNFMEEYVRSHTYVAGSKLPPQVIVKLASASVLRALLANDGLKREYKQQDTSTRKPSSADHSNRPTKKARVGHAKSEWKVGTKQSHEYKMSELELRWKTLQGEGSFTEKKMKGQFRNWTGFACAWTNGKSHNEKVTVTGDINLCNTSQTLRNYWRVNCTK